MRCMKGRKKKDKKEIFSSTLLNYVLRLWKMKSKRTILSILNIMSLTKIKRKTMIMLRTLIRPLKLM